MQDQAPAHAALGASSAHRWIACPGSIRHCAGVAPEPPTKDALEGTVAHSLADWCLQNGRVGVPATKLGTAIGGVTIRPDMVAAVDLYLRCVWNAFTSDCVIKAETRYPLPVVGPDAFGTCDAAVYNPQTRTLAIFDFKFGAGILVEADNNPQLEYYALAAFEHFVAAGCEVDRVTLTIVQPRAYASDEVVRTQAVDLVALMEAGADLADAAERTRDPNASLKPGGHCQFCPGRVTCPAMQAHVNTLVEQVEAAGNDPANLSPEALAVVLDTAHTVKIWIRAVERLAYNQAQQGKVPTGYKLVDKRGKRHWIDPDRVPLAALEVGVVREELISETLRTPPQLEKIIGRKRMAALADEVSNASSGQKLVPQSHPSPAADPRGLPSDDFDDVKDTDDA